MAKRNVLTQGRKRKGDEASIAGRLGEAREIFESVCRTDPLDVEAWVKLSLVHKRQGDLAAAERSARRAVALQPRIGFAHHALAVALHGQGRLSDAIDNYRTAIRLQPDFADSHYLLGNALHETGAVREAIGAFHRALALRPDFPEALGDLGGLLLRANEIEEAEARLTRALALQPANAIALLNLSQLLRLRGEVDRALETLRHALFLAPDAVEVIGGLAGLLEKTGHLDEAAQLVERGLSIAPLDPTLNRVAAELERHDKHFAAAAERLEALCRRSPPRDVEADCRLLLGQIYDQMGDAAKAWLQIVEGKRIQSSLFPVRGGDRNRYLDRVATISALATEALAGCEPFHTNNDELPAPAFLIGFPRSGTTLLEQILDSHPEIQTMEERGAVAHMVNEFLTMTAGRKEPLASLAREEIQHLRDSYFAEVDRNIDRKAGTLLVDKMPLNTVGVPVIWRVFPEARFILALRHPCDVCLSCLMQNFAVNEGMASFFSLEDTVRTYAAVMGAWRKYESLLPLDSHRLRYEDLIANVEGETRRLLGFLGLPWNDAVLRHTEHARRKEAINTPSYHQVRQPIYQSAKFRWQRYREAFEPVMPVLQPFIEHFGYEPAAE